MTELLTNWIGLAFPSPVLLASLTPFSHCTAEQHAAYLLRAIDFGAGGIILPSVTLNPGDDHAEKSKMFIEVRKFKAGLSGNDSMGFSLLGKTGNLLSLDYSIRLAELLRNKRPNCVPILASVANNGCEEDFLSTIRTLLHSSLFDGLELNYACPNIQTAAKNRNDIANLLHTDTLQKIAAVTQNFPVSIKLRPRMNESDWQWVLSAIPDHWGITLSNAYLGLEPPSCQPPFDSPYKSFEKWSPAGIYGPFERLLTYYDLYRVTARSRRLDLVSSVGGYITDEHVLQAILLGSCTVQLSSAIVWNGIQSFRAINQRLRACLSAWKVDSIQDIRGSALPNICDNVDDARITKSARTAQISAAKCNPPCHECGCTDKLCFAISQEHTGALPVIDDKLCSGCGWCVQTCRKQAVSYL